MEGATVRNPHGRELKEDSGAWSAVEWMREREAGGEAGGEAAEDKTQVRYLCFFKESSGS